MVPFGWGIGSGGPVYAVITNNCQISGLILTKMYFLLMLCIHCRLAGVGAAALCCHCSLSGPQTGSTATDWNIACHLHRGVSALGISNGFIKCLAGGLTQHSCSQSQNRSWLPGLTQCKRAEVRELETLVEQSLQPPQDPSIIHT